MGFLSSGAKMGIGQGLQGSNQALQNFLNFYMQNKELNQRKQLQESQIEENRANAQERKLRMEEMQRKAQEDAAMKKELSDLYTPQSAQDMAFAPDVITGGGGSGQPAVLTPQGEGMMTGQPSLEQYLSVLGKYRPEAALTAGVSLQNTEERAAMQLKIQEIQIKAKVDKLASEQAQNLKIFELTSDRKFKEAADKAESDKALLMERLQGLKDIEKIKNEKPPKDSAAEDAYKLWAAAKKKRNETVPDFDYFYENIYKTQNPLSIIFGGGSPPPATLPRKELKYDPKTGKWIQ